MKREALRKARDVLRNPAPTVDAFAAAMQAILTLGDQLSQWSLLVESAYPRLSPRDQRRVRYWMLSFYYSRKDFGTASRFIPIRFAGEFKLTEMVFAVETFLALGRMDQAKKLAPKLVRLIQVADCPMDYVLLAQCFAEYLARTGDWESAIKLLESARFEPTLSQNAVIGLVEIHVAHALRAIHQGLQLVTKFNQEFDPEHETMLPGNARGIQHDAEREFRRLEKILVKIVPKERQRELGIAEK